MVKSFEVSFNGFDFHPVEVFITDSRNEKELKYLPRNPSATPGSKGVIYQWQKIPEDPPASPAKVPLLTVAKALVCNGRCDNKLF